MALHHKLCHVIAGTFGLPHAETYAVILPHSLSYNAPKIPDAMKTIADALPGSGSDAIKGLNKLLVGLGINCSLKSLNLKEEDIPEPQTLWLLINSGIIKRSDEVQ
ncbi:hypothetical protein ACHAQJ_008922 [Trichoderma viride]